MPILMIFQSSKAPSMSSTLKNNQKWQKMKKSLVRLEFKATYKTRNPTFENLGTTHSNKDWSIYSMSGKIAKI